MPNVPIVLKGMTWDHSRGFDPMVVSSEIFCNEHYPNAHIVWEKRSLQAFADRPIDAMIDEYDLMVIDHPQVGAVAESGNLVALNDKGYDKKLALLEKQSAGVSHQSYCFAGQQWALAIDAATPISAYRPDLLKTIPTTWDEVADLATAGQIIWPLIPINALMSYFNLLANIGHDFGKSKEGLDEEISAFVLTQMKRVSDNIPTRCFSMDPIATYEWLACRSSHAYCPYVYGYSNYSRANFRPHRVRVSNIPSLGKDKQPIGSAIGGTGIAVSKRTKYPHIAIEYAFWLASADCQKSVFFDAGGQPANREAWLDERCNALSGDFFKSTLETLEKSYLRPRHKGYMRFQDIAGDFIVSYLRGEISESETTRLINEHYSWSLQ